MNIPEWLKPGLFGAAAGAIALAIVGFSWGGWVSGGTVKEKVAAANQTATVAALAPICADEFKRAANTESTLIAKINAVDSWERDSNLLKDGWATFAGGAKSDAAVAQACANMLSKTLKLK